MPTLSILLPLVGVLTAMIDTNLAIPTRGAAGGTSLFVSRSNGATSVNETAVSWVACEGAEVAAQFPKLSCATFVVPLDHSKPEDGRTVALKLAKWAADEGIQRLGTLFLNPGGPGGSGVESIQAQGALISQITGGVYDAVSWDPRGVGSYRCFASAFDESLFVASYPPEPTLPPDICVQRDALPVYKAQMQRKIALDGLRTRQCEAINAEIAPFLGTTSTVHDLDLMAQALWKEGDAEEGINYWGISYGSAIGAYLTGMFPHRVGRVVLDGVVPVSQWANGDQSEITRYIYRDTDKAFISFAEECAKAGPSRCALAPSTKDSSTNSSAWRIIKEIEELLEKTYETPLLVADAQTPGVLAAAQITTWISSLLSSPRTWPGMALALRAAVDGNGTAILNAIAPSSSYNASAPASDNFANQAIRCNDARPSGRDPLDDKAILEELIDEELYLTENVSHWFGRMNDGARCRNTRVTEGGFGRFTGPFNTTLKNPILLLGNTADPTTSVQNAIEFQALQPQTRIVQQDGPGHTSFVLNSMCTLRIVQTYLVTGQLPEGNTLCPVNEAIFSAAA